LRYLLRNISLQESFSISLHLSLEKAAPNCIRGDDISMFFIQNEDSLPDGGEVKSFMEVENTVVEIGRIQNLVSYDDPVYPQIIISVKSKPLLHQRDSLNASTLIDGNRHWVRINYEYEHKTMKVIYDFQPALLQSIDLGYHLQRDFSSIGITTRGGCFSNYTLYATEISQENQSISFIVLVSLGSILIILIILLVIILAIMICKRKKRAPAVELNDIIHRYSDGDVGETNQTNYTAVNLNRRISEYIEAKGSHALGELEGDIPISDVQVGDIIGTGSFGRVFMGLWTSKNLQIAIKALKADGKPTDVERFTAEAKLMQRMKPHPNVVQFYGVITGEKTIALAMELLSMFCLIANTFTHFLIIKRVPFMD
jgi:hypothetical protein